MEDFKNKETIYKRFNAAAYDLALAQISHRNGNTELFIKHKRDAGEAISQTLEFALKCHLDKVMTAREKQYFKPSKQTLAALIGKYTDDETDAYLTSTVDDSIEPSVDFNYLIKNKAELTNLAKHEGAEPDFEIQKRYFYEVRKFISEYIDANANLKDISDYEKADLSNWDLFYSACDRFINEERNYILIIGPNSNVDKEYLKKLGIPNWNLIIDFDYSSIVSGFYNSAYSDAAIKPHIIKATDIIDSKTFSIYSKSHYHYFANNYQGSGETEALNFSDWNRKYGKNAELTIRIFAEVFSNQRNVVVTIFNSRRHVDFICNKIEQSFGGNNSFVFSNDSQEELAQTAVDFNGIKVNIGITEIAEGLSSYSSNFGKIAEQSDEYFIPFMEQSETKTSGVLNASELANYEEYFEVLHRALPDENDNMSRENFLMGESKISWSGLKNRFDVERQNFNRRYIKPLEKLFEKGRGKVFLFHEAGFGGTTIARRIAWEFHNDYPTLILKKYKETKVRELLISLHQKTRKVIFVIMEAPQSVSMDEIDTLYKSIPQARPIVLLIVKRGKPNSSEDLSVVDWGNDTTDLFNAYKPFLGNLYSEKIRLRKENEMSEIIYSSDTYKKTPFYFGLITFEETFTALKDYIGNFVNLVSEKESQKKTLLFLSICEVYLGVGLPATFFKNLFNASDIKVFRLEDYFFSDTLIIDSLLTFTLQGNQKIWRIKHFFFANELKKQLLSGKSENPESWKINLADVCVDFIDTSSSISNISEYIQDILIKLFIGNKKDRAGDDFTLIINDIDSLENRERIFLALQRNYPDNPHYYSHLARFYAYHLKNNEKAINYADKAITLSETQGIEDPLLYHIKGMCLRSNIYEIIKKHRNLKSRNFEIPNTDYVDLIESKVPEAESQFIKAREISKKQNKIDEYGYIAHIQLLVSAIDYAITMSNKSKVEFFKQNKDPFSDWLDIAETLLDEVKRINSDNDESGKIEECVNNIIEFYDNYEQILQNLRNQLDNGKNPTRTRRQIARIYFRKKENYYSDNKVITSILSLMEQNIENEPNNEINFYLWFQAARYSKITIDEALSKTSKWKANSNTTDAIYYLYILKVVRALDGYSDSVFDANNLIRECKSKGKSNIVVYEWYGSGFDLNKLVNRNSITEDNKNTKLQFVEGYFTEYLHDGSGKITIQDKLEVFFSPTQAKLTSSDLNRRVQFYLGFSYDGLRADSASVQIIK